MKILIVGGSSTVGRSLKEALSESFEIITAGRKGCDITIDLRDQMESYKLPEGLDAIIHTAAQFGIRDDQQILDTEDVNVLGTLKLCQSAFQAKAKHFIFISSIYSSLSRESVNYNFYSLSKKHAEEVAGLYCSTHNIPLTIIRPSPLYGNDDGFKVHQPFFYLMMDKAERGENITLYGNRDPVRNYLHIDDLIEIIKRIIVKRIEGTFSCSFTTDVSFSRIANAAYAAFNSQGKIEFLRDKPDIPDVIFEKDFSLYDKINFSPEISIETGIKNLAKSRLTSK